MGVQVFTADARNKAKPAGMLVCIALLAGCSADREGSDPLEPAERTEVNALSVGADPSGRDRSIWFAERAAESGLDFVHFNGASGRVHFPEIMTPGAALLDYDNDGDVDALLVQNRALEGEARQRIGRCYPRGADRCSGAASIAMIWGPRAMERPRRGSSTLRRRAASTRRATEWEWQPATTTTTVGSTSI